MDINPYSYSLKKWFTQASYRRCCEQYLVLPRDGDTACDKLVVEVVVCGVEVHAFDCGELLDVQDVFTVHGSRLRGVQKGGE